MEFMEPPWLKKNSFTFYFSHHLWLALGLFEQPEHLVFLFARERIQVNGVVGFDKYKVVGGATLVMNCLPKAPW